MTTDDIRYDVSVILCSYNRADHLEKTLRSLRDVEVPDDWDAEVLLVDNASTDETPEVMEAFAHPEMSVRTVREGKQGLSHARNRGVEAARGRVLLFTDDDVRFPKSWMGGMARPILEDGADAVAGGVTLASDCQADCMTPVHRSLLASTERINPEDPSRIVGANMAIAKRVFDTIPKFDPELGGGKLGLGEETLFSWQMREAGFEIETVFDLSVRHHPDPSRLTREGWKSAAQKAGRSEAYRSYHWEHRRYSLLALTAGWAFCWLRVWWHQIKSKWESNSEVQMPVHELQLRRQFHRVRQHLREHGRSPKYKKRGLTKKQSRTAKCQNRWM